ncbi:hypothetical protein ASPZODRAFT_1158335 [Penicilliopsis zonata CBS 506.65]|uniref:DUF833 domain-containing protein n=1 Tax=Penicilliopsis zonata CBS 506.65 TaxID=1073090 RepID=A0A1L9STH5_9EURO|nr:hypothetical protein ASPZODRAFT_1158335 [Penicilliopsis zonata CBS 506.65]OJJ50387.1 hypothetical protein ASPZODRAFT_1158335 [Penicilliopsis zonata CBS 506.65]
MCIALLSTAHPAYQLILINNRDEFLHRPTSRANWWPTPHGHVLGAQDLARPLHATWLGITRQGRLAVLTNFHETSCEQAVGKISRGAIVHGWLTLPADHAMTVPEFVGDLVLSTGMGASASRLQDIGGFNLICGQLGSGGKKDKDGSAGNKTQLAILSNREDAQDQTAVADIRGRTIGVSNTGLHDRSWEKVILGERLMEEAIAAQDDDDDDDDDNEQSKEDRLIRRLLAVLSTDTLPRLEGNDADNGVEAYLPHLPSSIFIPRIGQDLAEEEGQARTDTPLSGMEMPGDRPRRAYLHGVYATQKQTVILVGFDGRVRYFERTLYDDEAKRIPEGEGDCSYEFMID